MNEEDVICALTDAINERLAEINFYRGEGNGLTKYEMRDRAKAWFKEALFPSTSRVKDKPASGGKGAK